jgi:hypothetical protein
LRGTDSFDVFGPKSDPYDAGKRALYARYLRRYFQLPRRFHGAGLAEYAFENPVGVHLHELCRAGWKFAASLDTLKQIVNVPPVVKRIAKQVDGRYRILNCQVDTDPASG